MINLKDLEVGDEFWECEYGENYHYAVTEGPTFYPKDAEGEYKNGWGLKAMFLDETELRFKDGEMITTKKTDERVGNTVNFFVNVEYESYLRIYSEPQYFRS